MKTIIKILIPGLLLSLAYGCSNFDQDNELLQTAPTNDLNSSVTRILEIANVEAEHFFPSSSRSDMRLADISGIKTITVNIARSEIDTLIYVVNFADNKGFALISAKDNRNPLLAIVPKGHYDPEIGTSNPGFNMFIDAAKASAMRIGKLDPVEGNDPSIPYWENGKYVKYERSTIAEQKIESKIGVDFCWNQFGVKGLENVYGYFCPNKTAGCVPVAIGSVITYYFGKNKQKTTVTYTFPERQRDSDEIDWAEIYKHKSSTEIYHDGKIHWDECVCSPSVHNTIGHFLRQIGADVNSNYKADSITSTLATRISIGLKKYLNGYTISGLVGISKLDIRTALTEGVAILVGKNCKNESHAWVVDGLSYKKVIEKRYESETPLTLKDSPTLNYNWVLVSTNLIENTLCYTHWGWGGDYDGWFNNSCYDPGQDGTPFIVNSGVTIKE